MNILLINNQAEAMERQRLVISENCGVNEIRCCRPGLELLDVTKDFVPDLVMLQAGGYFFDLGIIDHLTGINSRAYIILAAGAGEQELLEQALEAGVDDFIAGPPSDSELILRIKKGLLCGSPKERRLRSGRTAASFHMAAVKKSPLAAAARIAGNAVFGVLLIFMALLAFFLVQSKYMGGSPSVFGCRIYAVLSGSMNPAFDTGSLVFVRPAEPRTIAVGDIITFSGRSGNMLTTHRVVDINSAEELEFTTRGDANNADDPNPVPASHVVGRVHGSLPYLGYLMGFARTRQGLILLVFAPAVFVILLELGHIFKYMRSAGTERSRSRDGSLDGSVRRVT